jgi:phage tail protein X
MQWTYVTQQGDTWDVLALDIYGTEMLQAFLIAANPDQAGVLFFPAGVTLVIPDTPITATALPQPPWAVP